jgi:hypothetical protein
MPSISTYQNRWVAATLAGVVALALILAAIPAVEATSKMNPQRPFSSAWGVKGKTFRNNSCGTAICAYESVSLYRSSWRGYRYVRGSKNYNVGSRTTAYSRRACRSGTYTYQTRHSQKLIFPGSGGVSIQGNGINFTYWSTRWVTLKSPRTLRTYKNSFRCENGRR